jgi:hypothetical protein
MPSTPSRTIPAQSRSLSHSSSSSSTSHQKEENKTHQKEGNKQEENKSESEQKRGTIEVPDHGSDEEEEEEHPEGDGGKTPSTKALDVDPSLSKLNVVLSMEYLPALSEEDQIAQELSFGLDRCVS